MKNNKRIHYEDKKLQTTLNVDTHQVKVTHISLLYKKTARSYRNILIEGHIEQIKPVLRLACKDSAITLTEFKFCQQLKWLFFKGGVGRRALK